MGELKARKKTQRQILSERSLSETVPLNSLTLEEAMYLARLLSVWVVNDREDHTCWLESKGGVLENVRFGEASFYKLRYKIENYLSPKDIS